MYLFVQQTFIPNNWNLFVDQVYIKNFTTLLRVFTRKCNETSNYSKRKILVLKQLLKNDQKLGLITESRKIHQLSHSSKHRISDK